MSCWQKKQLGGGGGHKYRKCMQSQNHTIHIDPNLNKYLFITEVRFEIMASIANCSLHFIYGPPISR